MTISPRPHAVTRGATKNSEIGTTRSPAAEAIRTFAPCTSSAGAVSLAGEALQMFPTMVARLRIATEPTSAAACTRAGYHAATVGSATRSAIVTVRPIRTPLVT